jgi:hypothetical protein
MLYIYALAAVGLVAWTLISRRTALAKNIAAAKQTGLPYFVLPWYNFSTPWMIVSGIFIPVFNKLPTSWTKSWLRYVQ